MSESEDPVDALRRMRQRRRREQLDDTEVFEVLQPHPGDTATLPVVPASTPPLVAHRHRIRSALLVGVGLVAVGFGGFGVARATQAAPSSGVGGTPTVTVTSPPSSAPESPSPDSSSEAAPTQTEAGPPAPPQGKDGGPRGGGPPAGP